MTSRQGFIVDGATDRGLDGALDFAACNDFSFVELNMEHGFDRSRIDAERVRRLADEAGVDLLVHLPYRLDPGSPHEHVREGACRELEASIDAAAAMGAERGVVHATTSVSPDYWDDDTLRDCLFDSVRRLHDYGADADVEVVVENLKGWFDAGDFPALFERTDAAMCLDTGHAHVSGMDGAAQAEFLREYGDRIDHVHLNDTRRATDDEHLPVGLGRVAFAPLVEAMVETDWSGTCTHEVFGFDLTYVAGGKERFDEALATAR